MTTYSEILSCLFSFPQFFDHCSENFERNSHLLQRMANGLYFLIIDCSDFLHNKIFWPFAKYAINWVIWVKISWDTTVGAWVIIRHPTKIYMYISYKEHAYSNYVFYLLRNSSPCFLSLQSCKFFSFHIDHPMIFAKWKCDTVHFLKDLNT